MAVQVETTNMIGFELSVGDHLVRFSPRGPHKDDLTIRSLPHLTLKGTVQGSRRTMIPSVSLELSVKQVVIDITTDVLNQLLVLQNSFIKVARCTTHLLLACTVYSVQQLWAESMTCTVFAYTMLI